MHELSIAHELVDLATEQVLRAGATRALSLHLRLGVLAGIAPGALRQAFLTAREGTPAESAALLIEEVPAAIYCALCDTEQQLSAIQSRRCPACNTPAESIVRGAEMELAAMEVA